MGYKEDHIKTGCRGHGKTVRSNSVWSLRLEKNIRIGEKKKRERDKSHSSGNGSLTDCSSAIKMIHPDSIYGNHIVTAFDAAKKIDSRTQHLGSNLISEFFFEFPSVLPSAEWKGRFPLPMNLSSCSGKDIFRCF